MKLRDGADYDPEINRWKCIQCGTWVEPEEMYQGRCDDCRMAEQRLSKLEPKVRLTDIIDFWK